MAETLEQILAEAKKNFDENTRDGITLDNPSWFQSANAILDGKKEIILREIRQAIVNSAEARGTSGNIQAVASYVCDLLMERLDELVKELLARRIDQGILDELLKRQTHTDTETQAHITELIAIKPILLATATTRAEIDEFNERALSLLTAIEATEYQSRVTFCVLDQEHTFDASEPATALEQMGNTDKMFLRCRDSYRKDTEDSVMMDTPPPPRRKLSRANLNDLTVADVVASIPRQWTNMRHQSFFGLTFSPHITVEFSK